jgi:hypothetical protein
MNRDKLLSNKVKRSNFKGIMPHIKGLPPSPNWSNRFTVINFGTNLLYLTNSYICNIDLTKKEFFQLLNCNQLDNLDKPAILTQLDNLSILMITTKGYFIIFHSYSNFNKEDTRVYFIELKEFFKFVELDSQPKALLNIHEDRLLFIGTSNGKLLAFSYEYKHSNSEMNEIINSDIKYLYEISLGLNNYITDMRYYHAWHVLIVVAFNGDFYMYRYSEKGVEKVMEIEMDRKTIYSFDYIVIDGVMKISAIDKNGTLNLYQVCEEDEMFKTVRLYYDKNRYNDKGIQEKFVMFTTKVLTLGNDYRVIVTSNKGKIYYTTINMGEESKAIFKELSDNPHTLAIYNILNIESKIYFISADWMISCFNTDLIFESDIKCLGTKPKTTKVKGYTNKNLYLLSEECHLYRYNFAKLNGLSSSLRKLSRLINNIYLLEQAKFNENIFAITSEDKVIYIYDFNNDIIINKFHLDKRPTHLIFNSKRKYLSNTFTNDKVNKTVNELFSETEEYELLYISCSEKIVVWDYINDKTNNIYFDCHIKYNIVIPLKNDDMLLINLSSPEIKISLFNQLLVVDLLSFKHNFTEGNFCDYFLTDENFFILVIENQHDLKLVSFCKDYLKDLFSNEEDVSKSYTTYLNKYNKIKASLKGKKLYTELLFTGFTNSVVSGLSVLKEYCIKDEKLFLRLAICQIDGVIKVYEITLEEQLKLILRYSISAHLGRVNEVCWLNHFTITSTSIDHSLKLWNVNLCKDLDLLVEHKNIHMDNKPDSHKMTNSFTKINSIYLFQQSYKASQHFIVLFEKVYTEYSSDKVRDINDIEFNLFSLHRDSGLNYLTACRVVNYELLSCSELLNYNKVIGNIINLLLYKRYFGIDDQTGVFEKLKEKVNNSPIKIDNIIDIMDNYNNLDYLSEKYSSILKINFLILLKEKSYREAIDLCLQSQCYIDAIIIYKLSQFDNVELYFNILDRLRGFIYSKFIFQAQKLQKVVDVLKTYFK